MSDVRPTVRLTLKQWLVLLIICLLGTAARFHAVDSASLWADELSSLQFSCGRGAGSFGGAFDAINCPGIDTTGLGDARSIGAVWFSSREDTHPPLHAMLLRGWRAVFGESATAARSLSAIVSLLAIVALFDAVRSLHGDNAAFLAATIMAVAAPQIEFAQEARGYALLTFLTLTTTALMLRLLMRAPSAVRWCALVVVALLALLTHYGALPFIGALIAYLMIRLSGRLLSSRTARNARGNDINLQSRPSIERDETVRVATTRSAEALSVLALFIALLLFAVIWGTIAWSQRGAMSSNLDWLGDAGTGFVGRLLRRVAVLPLRLFITPMNKDVDSAVGMLSAIAYLSPLLLIWRREFLLWILILFACIAAVAASDLLQQRQALEWLRYTLTASPALYALVATLPVWRSSNAAQAIGNEIASSETLARFQIDRRARPIRLLRLVPGVFIIGCVLALPDAYPRPYKQDYRGFVAEIDKLAGPDDLLITHGATRDDWKCAILLAATSHYSFAPKRPTLILTHATDPGLIARMSGFKQLFFISPETNLPIGNWIAGGQIVEQRNVPFVGSVYRVIVVQK